MASPKWLRRRLATSMINAICQNFGKLCSAVFLIYLFIYFRKLTLHFVLGSYAIANRYNNSFVLSHFSPVNKSLPWSIVSILKPLLADNSWFNRPNA